jgi:hypothetical protein
VATQPKTAPERISVKRFAWRAAPCHRKFVLRFRKAFPVAFKGLAAPAAATLAAFYYAVNVEQPKTNWLADLRDEQLTPALREKLKAFRRTALELQGAGVLEESLVWHITEQIERRLDPSRLPSDAPAAMRDAFRGMTRKTGSDIVRDQLFDVIEVDRALHWLFSEFKQRRLAPRQLTGGQIAQRIGILTGRREATAVLTSLRRKIEHPEKFAHVTKQLQQLLDLELKNHDK